jgi:hypothetical protein
MPLPGDWRQLGVKKDGSRAVKDWEKGRFEVNEAMMKGLIFIN